jgi:hypothetical protein
VLREVLGLKTNKVAKDWRNLHNEKVGNFYSSSDTVKTIGPSRPTNVFMVVKLGYQDQTIKQTVITFLRGVPRTRLSDRKRNEDTRTKVNAETVNEMEEEEEEGTRMMYLRR